MSSEQKEKMGLMSADKYFYLNQGENNVDIDGKVDKQDYEHLQAAMQVSDFPTNEPINRFERR